MHKFHSVSLSALALSLGLAAAAPAHAQQAAPTAQEEPEPEIGPAPEPAVTEDTIVVFGRRLLGQVEAPQPPILELGTEDIAAYGASSIADLLDVLAPQVSSSRGRGTGGRPVILVNGMRISSFRELRSYPPEAIERMEVFPEEVAQRYGYSPDQRVVNFILQDNFSSREIEVEYGQPWDGGFSEQAVEGTYLMISGPSRLNFNLGWSNSSVLTEAERGVIQADAPGLPGDPDPAEYRSLVSDSAGLEATANWTTRLDDAGNSLSLNGTFERDDSLRLQGLDPVLLSTNEIAPLGVDSRSETYALGSTLNLGLGDWEVTGTLDGSHISSRSFIGTLPFDADLGSSPDTRFDEALTDTYTGAALVTARSNPIYLPAGDVSVTLDAGFDWNRINSQDTRNPGMETELTRGDLTTGVNVSVPLTSREDEVLGAVGDFTLNVSAGLDHLSDLGTLYDWSLGLTWGLTDTLAITGTYINRDSAPTLGQLGNPEIATPNVPVFDIVRNETVLATVVTGGNPFLPAQNQSDWKIGAVWDLPFLERSNLSIDYIRNHSDDVASSFPVLTPEIEAAFPDRVIRDATGRLVQLDERPVTFAEQDVERLQFGLNLSGQIGSEDDEENGGGGPPAGGFGGRPGGGPGAGGPPGAGGGFDPARFQAMRQLLCGEDGSAIALRLARGETVTGPDGEEVTLPPMMLERFQGGGEPDPEQVEQTRQQICSADGPPGGAAQAGGGGRGGPPGFGPPGGGNTGRWFFNLQYTRDLQNEVLVAPGGPLLDLLEGDALAGGGQTRDSASFRLGAFYGGFGTFVSGRYTGSSRIEGSGLPGSTDLFFDDYASFDIRMFVDLNQQESLVESVPLLSDVRISFDLENIFDARQRVTDAEGVVPLRYQPFLIDPVGRSFEIELRKLF